MANVAAGTVWNLPNYAGEIFTASPTETPFLSMIGAMSNGGLQTENFEFPVDQEYDHEAAAQPAITETASLTAPTAISYVRTQNKNVTQIFHEQVSLSYAKISNSGRLSGINTAGQQENPTSELDFQIARALEKIARDMEFTCFQGEYQIATNAGVANKTRGIIAAASTNTNASSAALSQSLMDATLLAAWNAGARFVNPVIWCGGFQKQKLSKIYGYAPADRNIGGVAIDTIETDFGRFGVMLSKFVPAGTLVIADMPFIKPVFQPVPEKGNFFYEMLSKTGASEKGQVYGQWGLAHGPGFMHAVISSLATS